MLIRNRKNLMFLIFLISSCYTPKYIKDSFNGTKYCYYPQQKVRDSMLRTNGYYQFKEIRESYHRYTVNGKWTYKIDTQYTNIVFYKDGLLINDYFTDYKGGSWGRFIIDNDIVKTLAMYEPGGMTSYFRETWFKLINKDSLVFLCSKPDGKMTDEDVNQYQLKKNKRNITFYRFVPSDSIPDANNCWIKQKKWFWCDEKQYELWKKPQKR